MKEKNRKFFGVWGVVLIASIVLMHFMLARMLGYPLTITPFIAFLFLGAHFKLPVSRYIIAGWVVLIIWPFIVLGFYDGFGGGADFYRYVRTYMLWFYALMVAMIAIYGPMKKMIDYSQELFVSLAIIAMFTAAQIASVKMFGTTSLYNIFGEHTYLYQYDIKSLSYNLRATGFYLEPSFCAFAVFTLISAIFMIKFKRHRVWHVSGIGLVSMAIIGSATGMLSIVILLSLMFSSTQKLGKARLVIVVLVGIVAVSISSFELSQRLAEINIQGTSGYWRLVAPLLILKKVLLEYPLGVPFGQLEAVLPHFGLFNGKNIGTSMDNGIYYLVFCFGWPATFLVIFLGYKLLMSVYKGQHIEMVYWWYVFASLQFSGGVLLPEYIFPFMLVTYQYRSRRFYDKNFKVSLAKRYKQEKPNIHGLILYKPNSSTLTT